MTTQRRVSDPAARRRTAVAVQTVLTSLVRTRRPTCVASYAPVGSEPGGSDLPEVLAAALAPGARLLLPVLRPDNDLEWGVFRGSLRRGPRGLSEPVGDPDGVDAIRAAELIIVPALAVDRAGHRLGRGGGSYDRALARVSGAFTIALLYDDELLDHVPAEPHDRPVDAVLMPGAGLRVLSDTPGWTK